MIEEAGVQPQGEGRQVFRLTEPVEIAAGDTSMVAMPHDEFEDHVHERGSFGSLHAGVFVGDHAGELGDGTGAGADVLFFCTTRSRRW